MFKTFNTVFINEPKIDSCHLQIPSLSNLNLAQCTKLSTLSLLSNSKLTSSSLKSLLSFPSKDLPQLSLLNILFTTEFKMDSLHPNTSQKTLFNLFCLLNVDTLSITEPKIDSNLQSYSHKRTLPNLVHSLDFNVQNFQHHLYHRPQKSTSRHPRISTLTPLKRNLPDLLRPFDLNTFFTTRSKISTLRSLRCHLP